MEIIMKKVFYTLLVLFLVVTNVCATVYATTVYAPEKMLPGTIIEFDNELNMTIVEGGPVTTCTSIYSPKKSDNNHHNITLSDDLSSYSPTELIILQNLSNDTLPVISVETEPIVVSPNSTIVYDGMGSIYKITSSTKINQRLTTWTYPANGTYYYGDFTPQSWIRLTDDYVMGQGYVTYFYGTTGYHGDNLDQMEANDPYINICATKMAYDRPNRGQEIKLRVLNSNWADTNDVYYVYKYDVGGLPEAILDLRERLFSQITNLSNGIFNGRYYYEKVPLTDPY